MAETLLASVDDLRAFMDDETIEEARAELLLRVASGEVRAATGLGFTYVEGDVFLLDGSGGREMLLPTAPVAGVVSLVEAPGRDLELELEEDDHFEWSSDGILRRLDGGIFRRRFRYYRAVVDHGFEEIPPEVVGVVLRAAGRTLDNPEAMRQETIGRYSYTKAGEAAGVGLYAPDLADLAPYMIGARFRSSSSSGSGS